LKPRIWRWFLNKLINSLQGAAEDAKNLLDEYEEAMILVDKFKEAKLLLHRVFIVHSSRFDQLTDDIVAFFKSVCEIAGSRTRLS
jgi:hypothetical protein